MKSMQSKKMEEQRLASGRLQFHMMDTAHDFPQLGDLLVRGSNRKLYVIDAISRSQLQGPFEREDSAIRVGRRLAVNHGVNLWRARADQCPELILRRIR